MLSSSLSLRSSTTLVSVSLFMSISALVDAQYTLKNTYQGHDFVNQFSFFDGADPTNGYVTYSDYQTSQADGRVTFNNNRFQMRVDSTTVTNPNGAGRGSVRIESVSTWTKGLFVADFAQLPERQCGIWPAWWTVNVQDYPNNGEIDILEGVNQNNENVASLHTGHESVISPDSQYFTGVVQTTDCNYNDPISGNGGGSVGCGILDRGLNSFGSPVGQANARAVAMEWTSDFIKVWNFAKGTEPADMFSNNPDPSQWPKPAQLFTGNDVNINNNFINHQMIFDTTLCGDYVNAVWASGGCAQLTQNPSCPDYVANNPSAFKNTYWDINQVKVFQKPDSSTTTSSTTSTTSTTSLTTATSSTSTSTSASTSTNTGSSTTTSTSTTVNTSTGTSTNTGSISTATSSTTSTSVTSSSTSSISSTSSNTSSSSTTTGTTSNTSTITSSSTTTSTGPIVTNTFILVVDFTQAQRKRQAQQYVDFDSNVGTVGTSAAPFAFDNNGYLKSDQFFISDNPLVLAQNFLEQAVSPTTPRFHIINGELVRDGGLFCALNNNRVIVYDGAVNKPANCRSFRLLVQVNGSATTTSSSSSSTTSMLTSFTATSSSSMISGYQWGVWSSASSYSSSMPSMHASEVSKSTLQSIFVPSWQEWRTETVSTTNTISKQWSAAATSASSQWNDWMVSASTSTPSTSGWTQMTTPATVSSYATWSEAPKQITTTITKTYVVPCPTGLETKTITVTTAYSTQAKPTVPMTTYVTTCPPEWGFGGPITVTVPVTVFAWTTMETKPWSVENKQTSTGSPKPAEATSGWESVSKPSATDTMAEWVAPEAASTSTKTATVITSAKPSEWNTWAPSAATPASTQAWEFWTTDKPAVATYTGVSGVKTYTGDAKRVLPSGIVGVMLAAIMSVMFM